MIALRFLATALCFLGFVATAGAADPLARAKPEEVGEAGERGLVPGVDLVRVDDDPANRLA